MFSKTTWIVIGSIAAAAGLTAIAIATVETKVTEGARFRIRDFFEVAPNCDVIYLKMSEGETADEQAFKAQLANANTYYFAPMVAAGKRAGIADSEQMAIFILEDIFPECVGQFPPDSILDVSKQVLWFAMWAHVQSLMETTA